MEDVVTATAEPAPEEALPEIVEQKLVDEAYQKFAQRCSDLGMMLYQKRKQDGLFEDRQKGFLFDIDKLAQKHDKLLSKLKKAQEKAKEATT